MKTNDLATISWLSRDALLLSISALFADIGYQGSLRGTRPFSSLWSLGYMLAAEALLVIGTSFVLHCNFAVYYLGAAGLGFATGSEIRTKISRRGWRLSRMIIVHGCKYHNRS